jgi:hypothetical protein
MRYFRFSFAAALLAAAGCAANRNTLIPQTVESVEDMKATITRKVPLRTPLADARRFMEQAGFKCEVHRNESCKQPDIVRADFLFCSRSDHASFFFDREWHIALVLQDDLVTDVLPWRIYAGL